MVWSLAGVDLQAASGWQNVDKHSNHIGSSTWHSNISSFDMAIKSYCHLQAIIVLPCRLRVTLTRHLLDCLPLSWVLVNFASPMQINKSAILINQILSHFFLYFFDGRHFIFPWKHVQSCNPIWSQELLNWLLVPRPQQAVQTRRSGQGNRFQWVGSNLNPNAGWEPPELFDVQRSLGKSSSKSWVIFHDCPRIAGVFGAFGLKKKVPPPKMETTTRCEWGANPTTSMVLAGFKETELPKWLQHRSTGSDWRSSHGGVLVHCHCVRDTKGYINIYRSIHAYCFGCSHRIWDDEATSEHGNWSNKIQI